MNLNELASECHEIARDKGFWDGIEPLDGSEPDDKQWRKIAEQVNHVLGELGEAMTEDYGPKHLEELADAAIVLLDLCQFLGLEPSWPENDLYPIPAWHSLSRFANSLRKEGLANTGYLTNMAQHIIRDLDTVSGYCLVAEMREKMAFNRQRPHKYGVHDG